MLTVYHVTQSLPAQKVLKSISGKEVRANIKNTYNVDVCFDNGEYIEYNEEKLKEVIRLDAYLLLNCCPKAHDRIEEQYHNDLMEQYYERD